MVEVVRRPHRLAEVNWPVVACVLGICAWWAFLAYFAPPVIDLIMGEVHG